MYVDKILDKIAFTILMQYKRKQNGEICPFNTDVPAASTLNKTGVA